VRPATEVALLELGPKAGNGKALVSELWESAPHWVRQREAKPSNSSPGWTILAALEQESIRLKASFFRVHAFKGIFEALAQLSKNLWCLDFRPMRSGDFLLGHANQRFL